MKRGLTDHDAILRRIEAFIRAYNAQDVAGIMKCYAADLVKTRQGAAPEGHAETSARLHALFDRYTGHLTVVNDEIVVSGQMAFVRGSLRIVLEARDGGESPVLEQHFLEIWRKEGGEWLVARTMDNSA